MILKIVDKISLFLWKSSNRWLGKRIDQSFELREVPNPDKTIHLNWIKYLASEFDKEGFEILEVGSREVTGKAIFPALLSKAQYTGFDIYEGKNVDISGDAHVLGKNLPKGKKYDLIFSSACFEHFAQPWKVANEMIGLLKVGGHVFVETHFAFSAHERPWHFYHFTDLALKSLFSVAGGISCIEAGMSNPFVGRFSSRASKYLKNKQVKGLYCHSSFFGKKLGSIARPTFLS